MPLMATLPVLVGLLGVGAPIDAVPAVGVIGIELADPSRRDPLEGGERRWRVDLYYPAQPGTGTPRTYAHDAVLLARMAKEGYYDVAPATLAAWARQPDAARRNARAVEASLPLVALSPGSGVAAFNYSELAAALARRGYAVAVIDHPYLGLTHLSDGRILSADVDPVQQADDPRAWAPRVAEWAGDVSATLDELPSQGAVREAGVRLDLARVLAVGHSLGGTVAVEVCTREPRVSACADFEGAVEGTTAYTEGPRRPTLFTGSRSAKPDRPFLAPDLSQPPWDFLARGGLSSNWAVAISGGSHMSFSDAPREMPDTLSRFGGTLMSAERSEQVYVGIVDALGRAYFPGGGGNATMAAFFREVPEAKAVHSP
jgi:pimeloyl-ACP methyl ester carboxylesterase